MERRKKEWRIKERKREIIKKLGTPTEEDVTDMNPDYQNK